MKARFAIPAVALGVMVIAVPADASGANAPSLSGPGKVRVHAAQDRSEVVQYKRKKKHRKKKRKKHPAATAPTAPTAPYLLTYEEAYAAISSWASTRASEFQASDSAYGTWYWDVDESTCHWNYYSDTQSLTCAVFYYDDNGPYCHFYFNSPNRWSAHLWVITARPTVPGSHSITIGEQYERTWECYA
jgi:hypothetical protein